MYERNKTVKEPHGNRHTVADRIIEWKKKLVKTRANTGHPPNEKKSEDYWCPGIFSCPGKKVSVGDCKTGKTGGKWWMKG